MPKRTSSARATQALARRERERAEAQEQATSFNALNDGPTFLPPNDAPTDIKDQLLRARTLWEDNLFIGQVIELWVAFANHGLRLKGLAPAKARPRPKATRPGKLEKPDPERTLRRWIRAAWLERYISSNVVSAWADFTNGVPIVLDLQQCIYRDLFGIESLKYKPVTANLSVIPDEATRKAISEGIEIGTESTNATVAKNSGFAVYRAHGRDGYGLQKPALYRVFNEASQWDNFTAGEKYLSQFCQNPRRHHLKGHEIKSGPLAGQSTHFFKAKLNVPSIQANFKNVSGATDFASNFDHQIKFLFPEALHWDRRRWESLYERLMYWAGPLGLILLQGAKSPASVPALLKVLQTQMMAQREDMAEYIRDVAWRAPAIATEVEPVWDVKCFQDARVWSELLKFGTQGGIVSPPTFNRETGRDDEEEVTLLTAAHKEAAVRKPVYDGAHGADKGKAAAEKGGRPSGTRDPNQ
jgi:hypothetical protein